MSSRYSAARPNRAGEKFARTHHNEDAEAGPSKKLKFDVRNPSALAPDAPEEDAVLEADVIGGVGGTKRGAVNLDGYDSDSDNEGFDARAEERAKGKKGDVNLAEALDQYGKEKNSTRAELDADDDEDMFDGAEDDEVAGGDVGKGQVKVGKKGKEVRFLEEDQIEGQVLSSKSGGHVSSNFALDPKGKLSSHAMDDEESSDDEEEAALAAE
jgi:CD2 antigen cytoplasmic tail-binding protein 2